MTRDSSKLDNRPWRPDVEAVEGDLQDLDSLGEAFAGIDVAFYLVHSLDTGTGFEERERQTAENARRAAESAGVNQIVYLGGLGDEDDDLSPHLASRHAVGRELAAGTVAVTELRAAVILGSGSASFEMLRGLVELLPVMVTPRWVRETVCQPIAITDVLTRLVGVVGRNDLAGVWEIGGSDVVTYEQLMEAYASAVDLHHRLVVPVPVLSPRLSSYWVDFVTTLPRSLAVELVESLQNDVIVTGRRLGPELELASLGVEEAIAQAVTAVEDLDIPTRWSAGARADEARPMPWDPSWAGGTVLTDERSALTDAPPDAVMRTVKQIGGQNGWHGFGPLWRIRGVVDELVGGAGWRRGRRHPTELAVGDMIDVFGVEAIGDDHVRLRADMRMPGHGWLEWRVTSTDDGRTRLDQLVRFVPRGLWGRAYWVALIPFHALIFGRMVERIAAVASE